MYIKAAVVIHTNGQLCCFATVGAGVSARLGPGPGPRPQGHGQG